MKNVLIIANLLYASLCVVAISLPALTYFSAKMPAEGSIGGSDGPTGIFMSSKPCFIIPVLILGLLLVLIGDVYYLFKKA